MGRNKQIPQFFAALIFKALGVQFQLLRAFVLYFIQQLSLSYRI